MTAEQFQAEVLKIDKLLYHISWSMLSNHEDCADSVQEALTRAWQNQKSLKNIKAFRAWLTQILMNVCKDMIRKREKQKWVPLEEDAVAIEAIDTAGISVNEILAMLSPEHRTVVVLFYLEGYKIREIAQMLDTPMGTIKSRLMYARIYLRKAVVVSDEILGGVHCEKI